MKLKTISATYDRKLNLGDYNSAHIAMTVWADIEPHENEADCAEALRQMARNNVMIEMARIKPELQAKTQELFAGLPVELKQRLGGLENAD